MLAKSLTIAALCALCAVVSVRAHHSHGNYDLTTWTTMNGEVKEVHLLVPHSWIYLDVKDDKNQVTTWALEATGPSGLTKVGVKREDVRPGDSHSGPLSPAEGRLERLPARLRDTDARRRRAGARRRARLGRRRRRRVQHRRPRGDASLKRRRAEVVQAFRPAVFFAAFDTRNPPRRHQQPCGRASGHHLSARGWRLPRLTTDKSQAEGKPVLGSVRHFG